MVRQETAVTVPFRGNHLTMSLDEAKELRSQLDHAITRTRQQRADLLDVELTPDGFITRDAVYEFFVQIYPSKHVLRNHAGKLFNRICELARYGEVPITVLCPECGKTMGPRVDCTVRLNRNHWDTRQLRINAVSLTKHRFGILDGEFRNIGPSFVDDLQLLLHHL